MSLFPDSMCQNSPNDTNTIYIYYSKSMSRCELLFCLRSRHVSHPYTMCPLVVNTFLMNLFSFVLCCSQNLTFLKQQPTFILTSNDHNFFIRNLILTIFICTKSSHNKLSLSFTNFCLLLHKNTYYKKQVLHIPFNRLASWIIFTFHFCSRSPY